MSKFDIIEFISGLTGYVFDKAVLQNIALKRGVIEATCYASLDERTIELMRADLLYTAYCSPNTIASVTQSHGSYSKSFGQQVVQDKEELYKMFMAIYNKYGDPMAEVVESPTLQWLDY